MVDVLAPSFKITVGEAVIVELPASTVPEETENELLTPFSDPAEFVAVMVQFPTLVILTVNEESTPELKFEVVPCPVPIEHEEVTTVVPENVVTGVPEPSTAVIFMLKLLPAILGLIFPEGTRSTVKPVSTPALTILKVELTASSNPELVAVSCFEPTASICRSEKSAIPKELVRREVVPDKDPEPEVKAISTVTPACFTLLPYWSVN